MAFSEAELVFLALIFIFTLVFLLLGKRNNISTAKNQKKKRKGSKRATRQRHCQDPHQHRTRRGPDENDDDEPYNPRGTILRLDFVMLLQLIHHFLKYDDWYPSIWDLLIPQIKYILHDFFQVLRLQESRRLRTIARHYYWEISLHSIFLGSCEERFLAM